MMRLSKLPQSVKTMLSSGELSAGHARALLSVSNPETTAKKIVDQGLTVRDVERIAQSEASGANDDSPRKMKAEKDADTKALEKALSDVIGLNVVIDHKAGGGVLSIRYTTLEQLDALCRRLRQ
jgi:ParB family chromosome partitioning protein